MNRADRMERSSAAESVGRSDRGPVGPAHGRPTRMTYWRRRAAVVLTVLGIALLLVLGAGYGGAEADLVQPETVGHATVEPGRTLWDVALEHAPDDVDPRTYLARMQEVNGLEGPDVPAWTVVLLPAR